MALSSVEPPPIEAAFAELRSADPRSDVELREIPAPGRGAAPYGFALEAELLGTSDEPSIVSGRFVVLHDPAGQPAWASTTRIVILVQGDVDETTGSDPLLPDVTWTWLRESLHGCEALAHGERGTVTTTASHRYGQPESPDAPVAPECDVELRASWSPVDPEKLLPHLAAFCDLLGAVAGVPPPDSGVRRLGR